MSEWIGKTKRATFFVVDEDGTPTDGTVTWTITRPDATTVTPTEAHPDTGTYQAWWAWDQVGEWTVEAASSGAVSTRDFQTFFVTALQPPDLVLTEAPAPWTTVSDVRLVCSAIATTGAAPDDIVQSAIYTASDLLFVLTGRQFNGPTTTTVRPCRQNNCFSITTYPLQSYGGVPSYPDPSAYPPEHCGCARLPSIDLGYWPITSIDQVRIDGAVVDPATYRLDANRYLVRLADAANGYINDGWPSCQYLDRASTEPGTFEVSFTWGVGPPAAGVAAANHLACELSRMVATGVCNIPGRATSVNRQQVSFTMINASMLQTGLTGLWDVDAFIIAYNPDKRRGTTVVWSPDLQRDVYRAGT